MADVDINKFRASVVRDGSKPASPGFVVSEGQDPVDPSGSGQNHLPVTIAAAATGLSITESQVLGGAGTTSQYLRGDASLATFPDLTGYVPYTGANQTVNLNTQQLQAGHTTLTTNGSTETLTINHTSGSGKAINVTKGGAGEGLYVNKTSGSGNAATIVGTLEATTLVKTGGTSSQFLKADGSVDSTSYGTGTVTSVGLSSATSGVTIGSTPVTTSGTITLAIATASGSQNGLLSSTDWTTFNNKQNALTNPVTGTGASGQVAYFTGTTAISSESNLFWDATNDRLGIGTPSPNDKLQMNGGKAIFATSNFNGTTAGGSVFVFSDDNNGGKIWAQKDGNQAWGYLALQPAGGNLLVGTTSDNGARLQVSGDARISNVLLAGGAANIDSSLAVQISTTGSGTQKWFGANKNGSYGLIVGYSETTGLSGVGAYIRQVTSDPLFFVVNNATTALTLASTGAATFSSSVTAAGTITSSTANYPQLIFQETTSSTNSLIFYDNVGSPKSLRFRVNGATNLMSINDNGNVLIGTTTDSGQRLQVSGAATFNGNINIQDSNVLNLGYNQAGGATLKYNANGNLDITPRANFNTVFTSGRVGIGTSSPTYPLTISAVTANMAFYNTFNNAGNRNWAIAFGVGSFGDFNIMSSNAQNGDPIFAGTSRLNIKNNGNVGIGTLTPQVRLHIYDATAVRFDMQDNTNTWATLIDNATGQYRIRYASGAINPVCITTGGEVLVGTTTTDVNTQGCQLRSFGLGIFVRSGASTLQLNRLTSDGIIASFRTNDVERGSISISGTTTSYNTTSDYRLKEDFKEINGLEKIGAIKVYDYKWKSYNKRMDGVLAHELAEVLPYAVFGEKDELDEYGNCKMQSVDYSKIVPILIKSIQELKQEIDTLKN